MVFGNAMRRLAGRTWAGPLQLPAYWGFFGDSQTDGRETETTAINHWTCFKIMWEASYSAASIDSHSLNGESGRGLAATITHLLSRSFAGTPWIHVQESGNQSTTGQTTAGAFGTTFYDGMVDINDQWPGCFISYETAYSFSDARKAEPYRNWDTYNTELRAQIAALAGVGVTVHLVESEQWILALVAELGYNTVCFADGDANAYHYQGIGNFMIALAMFHAFGYDVSALDHSGINLNSTHKSTAVGLF
jgi:hypothetical protein